MSSALHINELPNCVIIRFDRPEVRNPLSVSVIRDLLEILEKLENRITTDIIFTGVGRIFASGADLREIGSLRPVDAKEFARLGQFLMGRISSIPNKTIAAVNGPCFGGALDLAISCTTRIALPHATFCHPGAGLGIMTGWGGTQRLPRLIGEANALEMFFTAAPINAQKALSIGLIDKIVQSFDKGFDVL